MHFVGLTPIHQMGDIFVKREDLAHFTSLDYPSGSKVRQYFGMINTAKDIPPCIVGCSANSAQQIYVAATAHFLKTKGIIFLPKRTIKTDATKYCERLGAEIHEVKPGYLSVVKKQTRQYTVNLKEYIQWDRKYAILDTAKQCANIPNHIKRIVVATGSGLTAAGVMIGVAGRNIEVVAVATSPMVIGTGIRDLAHKYNPDKEKILGNLTFILPTCPYDKYKIDRLPDGTPLDPFYGAKAWPLVKSGDLFWPPGLRPVAAMPEDCRAAFNMWKGPV